MTHHTDSPANHPNKPRSYRLHAWWLTLGAAAAAAIALAAIPNLDSTNPTHPTIDPASVPSLANNPSNPNTQLVSTLPAPNTRADESPAATPIGQPAFDPVEFRQVVTRLDPKELLILDEQTPVRPVVADSIERFQWVDTKRNIQMQLEVPQRNVLLLSAPAD